MIKNYIGSKTIGGTVGLIAILYTIFLFVSVRRAGVLPPYFVDGTLPWVTLWHERHLLKMPMTDSAAELVVTSAAAALLAFAAISLQHFLFFDLFEEYIQTNIVDFIRRQAIGMLMSLFMRYVSIYTIQIYENDLYMFGPSHEKIRPELYLLAPPAMFMSSFLCGMTASTLLFAIIYKKRMKSK